MLTADGGPTLADWLQGWGTVAGAVFAVLAAAAAFAVLRNDRAVRRQDEAEVEIAQARGIVVSIQAEWDKVEISDLTFSVQNLSQSVIFDGIFAARRRDELAHDGWVIRFKYLRAGESSEPDTVSLSSPLPIRRTETPEQFVPMPPDLVETRIVFTDAKGLRWRRDGRTQPVRIRNESDADVIRWIKDEA